MDYDCFDNEEPKTVLSSNQDFRNSPINVTTRSFPEKLKARRTLESCFEKGRADTSQQATEQCNPTQQRSVKSDDKANDYCAPTIPDLNKFRKLVEKDDVEAVREAVLGGNPRLLVTSSDAPEILKKGVRYNALHCAVIGGCLEVCKLIMDILRGDNFWHKLYPRNPESVDDRRNHLLDLYLNMREEGNHETPLHLACKYGHEDIVEYLLCFSSMLDTSAKNKYGESPSQVTLRSSRISSEVKRGKIYRLLSEPSVYYVCVLRAPDNSLCPKLDKPCMLDELESKTGRDPRHSPHSENKVVNSFAGPMSPRQAKELYRVWRCPSQAADQHIKRSDPDRGLERVGRKLAHQQNVPWSEFWEFLKCFCDLSKEVGRKILEEYLRGVWSEEGPQSVHDLSSPKLSNVDYSSSGSEASTVDEEEWADLRKLSLQGTTQISRGHPVSSHMFLTGSEPTKLDYDVMLALNDSQDPVDSAVFPHIAKWLEVVHTYPQWQTPICVRGGDSVGHWKSLCRSHSSMHGSLTASVPHSQVTPQHRIFSISNLVYSASPSYPVKQAPKKLFHGTSSFPSLDLECN